MKIFQAIRWQLGQGLLFFLVLVITFFWLSWEFNAMKSQYHRQAFELSRLQLFSDLFAEEGRYLLRYLLTADPLKKKRFDYINQLLLGSPMSLPAEGLSYKQTAIDAYAQTLLAGALPLLQEIQSFMEDGKQKRVFKDLKDQMEHLEVWQTRIVLALPDAQTLQQQGPVALSFIFQQQSMVEWQTARAKVLEILVHLRSAFTDYHAARLQVLQQALFYFYFLLFFIISLFLLWSIYSVYFLQQRILKPLAALHSAIQAMDDQGQLHLPPLNHCDEFSDIYKSLNAMSQKVIQDFQKLRQADESKLAFLANMSHEIRTPMNAVLGLSNLALRDPTLTEKTSDYLKKITSAGQALLQLINDILDVSKIEAGRLELEYRCFLLQDVLNYINNIIWLRAYEKQLELLFRLHPDVPDVLVGDSLRLQQILLNLCGNAVKFTDKGYVLLEVSIARDLLLTDPDAGRTHLPIRFRIEDSGIGMNVEQQLRLFKAFSQADSSITRRFGGSGLGLMIAQSLVELMGGKIIVESAPGVGSEFSFVIWLGVAQEDLFPGQGAEVAQDFRNYRVLVIDDNALSQEILSEELRFFGLQVQTAASVEEALAILENTTFDLIFTDWKMPKQTGLDLAAHLQQNQKKQALPMVVLVSAYVADEIQAEAEQVGIRHFLAKPVKRAVLLKVLQQTLKPPQPRVPLQALSFSKQQVQVLLVEDNPLNQEVAQAMLAVWGVVVELAENGKIALEKVNQNPNFEAIFMDIQMPILDGISTTRLLRRQDFKKPIIAMTAHAFAEQKRSCLEAGMDDYLTKPLDVKALEKVVRRWLRPTLDVTPEKMQAPQKSLSINLYNYKEMPEKTAVPLLDATAGIARLGGNAVLYQRLLKNFLRSYQNFLSEIALLREKKDYLALIDAIHALKGVAGNTSLTALWEGLADLETALRQNPYQDSVPLLFKALTDVFPKTQAALADYLDALPQVPKSAPAPAPNLRQSDDFIEKLKIIAQNLDDCAMLEPPLVDFLQQAFAEAALKPMLTALEVFEFAEAKAAFLLLLAQEKISID